MYRARIAWHKVNGINFDHMGLVQDVFAQVDNNFMKECALKGERNIRKARAVEKLHWEPEPDYNWVGHMQILNQLQQ